MFGGFGEYDDVLVRRLLVRRPTRRTTYSYDSLVRRCTDDVASPTIRSDGRPIASSDARRRSTRRERCYDEQRRRRRPPRASSSSSPPARSTRPSIPVALRFPECGYADVELERRLLLAERRRLRRRRRGRPAVLPRAGRRRARSTSTSCRPRSPTSSASRGATGTTRSTTPSTTTRYYACLDGRQTTPERHVADVRSLATRLRSLAGDEDPHAAAARARVRRGDHGRRRRVPRPAQPPGRRRAAGSAR